MIYLHSLLVVRFRSTAKRYGNDRLVEARTLACAERALLYTVSDKPLIAEESSRAEYSFPQPDR